ncbi:MAG: hypothetical protein K8F92_02490 [Hyphomicrobium sp.]|uniref:hypothetical protein n=1 Tax=Hyphomicrobium sp. TaxID=82 RepID=UPI00132067C6|nr:hypothetical protein [Hyphomicrobium sp.]KAB2942539.1 MAG: hypothetical protein F9K20_06000 [Hyphomicrobium sp.]MBZ0208510.1 hypothetical protein [Hyphomicrobium sp.]
MSDDIRILQAQLQCIHQQTAIVHQMWAEVIASAQKILPKNELPSHPMMAVSDFLQEVGELRVALAKQTSPKGDAA